MEPRLFFAALAVAVVLLVFETWLVCAEPVAVELAVLLPDSAVVLMLGRGSAVANDQPVLLQQEQK